MVARRYHPRILVALLLAAALAAIFALVTVQPRCASAAFSGFNGNIAFVSNRVSLANVGGDFEIWSMHPDGTHLKNLTNNSQEDDDPAYSADGTKIAFSHRNPDGNYDIYTMNANGDSKVRLTKNSEADRSPTWSPNGKKIAFVSARDGDWEIYTINSSDSTGLKKLTDNTLWDGHPSWSPDGTKIAFHRDPLRSDASGHGLEIYTMNSSDGTGLKRLTDNSVIDENPDWSPNGQAIAFDSQPESYDQIYVMYALGNGYPSENLSNSTHHDFGPAISPTAAKIAFTSIRDGNAEIYTMNSEHGLSQTRLTNNPRVDRSPTWQPLHFEIHWPSS